MSDYTPGRFVPLQGGEFLSSDPRMTSWATAAVGDPAVADRAALIYTWAAVAEELRHTHKDMPDVLMAHYSSEAVLDRMLDENLDRCDLCGLWGFAYEFHDINCEPVCTDCKESLL